MSPFYQELVNLWANISQQNPTTFSEVCNQTLWSNSFITTLGKPVFYMDFIDKNMLRIADLLTDSGNFLSWQMARQKYNRRNKDIVKWFSLIASVPMSWKVEIRNYFSSAEDTVRHVLLLSHSLKLVYSQICQLRQLTKSLLDLW